MSRSDYSLVLHGLCNIVADDYNYIILCVLNFKAVFC